MGYCAVLHCYKHHRHQKQYREKYHISYHRFPKDPKFRKLWVDFCGRNKKWSPAPYSLMCSAHFTQACYRTAYNKPYLEKDAIPTENGPWDVETDMDNFIKHKLVGVRRLKLKKDIVPHKFACQKRLVDKPERSVVAKIKTARLQNKPIENIASPSHNIEQLFVVEPATLQEEIIETDPLEDPSGDTATENTNITKKKHKNTQEPDIEDIDQMVQVPTTSSSSEVEPDKTKSILGISEKKTMELVLLYKYEECLYNTEIEDYKKKTKRREAAEKIAEKLRIPNFEAKHVMMKLKNLRNSYCQELKKISTSVRNSDDPVYKPKVQYFPLMDSFLRPHLQLPARRGGPPTLVINGGVIKRETEPEPEGLEEPDELWDINDADSMVDMKFEEGSEHGSPRHEQEAGTLSEYDHSSAMEPPSKKMRVEDSESHVAQPSGSQSRPLDFLDSFGTYIASMLRTLPPEESLALQPKIVNLIASHMAESRDKPLGT